jgi:hypothetical protein
MATPTPNVVVSPPKPASPVEKMEIGDEVTQSHSSRDGEGAVTAPFAPQIMDLNEAVVFDSPMELEAFMHDQLQLQIHPPMGEMAETGERIITFRVRDKVQNVCLGSTQTLGRWCVEALARCRNAYVKADAVPVNTSSETHTYKNPTTLHTKALKYPFSVIYDPAGAKGHRWLNQILRDRL